MVVNLFRWGPTNEVCSWKRLQRDCSMAFTERSSCCPNTLVERMKQFEAEAILLRWTLDQFTRVQQNCTNPMARLKVHKYKDVYILRPFAFIDAIHTRLRVCKDQQFSHTFLFEVIDFACYSNLISANEKSCEFKLWLRQLLLYEITGINV